MNIIRPIKSCGVLLAAALLPLAAQAEQTTATGAGGISTAARVNMQVNVERFIRFRVGNAAALDTVTFNVLAPDAGNGVDIAGIGGDLGGGQVTVQITSNSGQVTITETNDGLGNGLTDGGAPASYVPYAEILTSTSNAAFSPPTLSNAGGGTAQPTTGADAGVVCGTCTRRAGTWTYAFDNAGLYAGATYTGQVTYTAATP